MSRQGVALDLPRRRLYIGCAVAITALVASCQPNVEPLAPETLGEAGVDQVAGWVAATVPASHVRYDIGWQLRHRDGSTVGGRGAVRIAPPDSLRVDLQAPLGLGAASAFVLGREVQWAEPKRYFRDLIPVLPLLWAAMGVALPPEPGDRLAGQVGAHGVTWRYVAAGDTLIYRTEHASLRRFLGEARQWGELLGRVMVTFDSSTSMPARADLVVPPAQVRLVLEFLDAVVDDRFDSSVWMRPDR